MSANRSGVFLAATIVSFLVGIVFVIAPPRAAVEKTFAASGCVAADEAAKAECAEQMKDAWYFGGAVDYTRRDQLKDEPRCARVGEAAYYACKGGTNE